MEAWRNITHVDLSTFSRSRSRPALPRRRLFTASVIASRSWAKDSFWLTSVSTAPSISLFVTKLRIDVLRSERLCKLMSLFLFSTGRNCREAATSLAFLVQNAATVVNSSGKPPTSETQDFNHPGASCATLGNKFSNLSLRNEGIRVTIWGRSGRSGIDLCSI